MSSLPLRDCLFGFALCAVGLGDAMAAAECGDAEILTLELGGELLPDSARVARIQQDLDLIRQAHAFLQPIHVLPVWVAGEIALQLGAAAWEDYRDGVFAEFEALNAVYGPPTIVEYEAFRRLFLRFDACYHPERLSAEYAQIEGVEFSSPTLIAGDGHDLSSPQLGRYLFKWGEGDCPAGCLREHYWEFEVVGSQVVYLGNYGDPVGVPDQPLQRPGVWLEPNVPNPFNPRTSLAIRSDRAGHATVRLLDARGCLVRVLFDAALTPGRQPLQWDGTDLRGNLSGSGVYFCQLDFEGQRSTRKLLLLQ